MKSAIHISVLLLKPNSNDWFGYTFTFHPVFKMYTATVTSSGPDGGSDGEATLWAEGRCEGDKKAERSVQIVSARANMKQFVF